VLMANDQMVPIRQEGRRDDRAQPLKRSRRGPSLPRPAVVDIQRPTFLHQVLAVRGEEHVEFPVAAVDHSDNLATRRIPEDYLKVNLDVVCLDLAVLVLYSSRMARTLSFAHFRQRVTRYGGASRPFRRRHGG